ncbi:MAG: hypothetical protein GF401_07015 [Chitinivibrionales bacterium]|nr:hypothetical protein [Chitinivibrionales bacterium]
MDIVQIKRALVSVSDKTGIVEFARKLGQRNIEILSTGGTARSLKEKGVDVTSVDSYTGFPEIMDGRVKTLHPKIHGGLLAMRDNNNHVDQMKENGIEPIDMVVVNLYPFKQTVAKPDVTIEDAIENIDIGGPTMIRSAAKNNAWVTVVVDPADYDQIVNELDENNGVSMKTRRRMALKAFQHTADYDTAISAYLSKVFT